MPVQVYRRESSPAIEHFADVDYVQILQSPPDCFATFGKGECACHTSFEWTVDGRTISFRDESHYSTAYPAYVLDGSVTEREIVTVLTWLTKPNLLRFGSKIENGTLVRFLTPGPFRRIDSPCGTCIRYRLEKTPVFCTSSFVISGENKGPTLESVLRCTVTPN